MKKTFIFYNDWIDYTEDMTLEEKWFFLQTILNYQNWKDLGDISSIKFVWSRVKKQLDENNESYENIVDRNRSNGMKGGRPITRKPNKTQLDLLKPSGTQTNLDNDNDIIINDNKKENKEKNFSFEIEEAKKILDSIPLENELKQTLNLFLEFRKQIKKPLKDISLMSFIKSLKNLSWWNTETAIAILDQSIANGWQGIFELKNSTKKQKIWTDKL